MTADRLALIQRTWWHWRKQNGRDYWPLEGRKVRIALMPERAIEDGLVPVCEMLVYHLRLFGSRTNPAFEVRCEGILCEKGKPSRAMMDVEWMA